VHRHTLLMNKVMILCIAGMREWVSTLYDHGYQILAIERSVRVEGKTVVPDIMLLNNRARHILVVDCKSGPNIKPNQESKYARMRLEDILEAARPPCGVSSHTFAYAANEEHVDRMREHTDFTIMAFGSHGVRGIGDFGHEGLTRELRAGVDLGSASEPRYAPYPFSINDLWEDIDDVVALGILACQPARPGARLLANRATAREVLRAAHPFHEKFAPAHRAELVEVVRLSIARILARRAPRWF